MVEKYCPKNIETSGDKIGYRIFYGWKKNGPKNVETRDKIGVPYLFTIDPMIQVGIEYLMVENKNTPQKTLKQVGIK